MLSALRDCLVVRTPWHELFDSLSEKDQPVPYQALYLMELTLFYGDLLQKYSLAEVCQAIRRLTASF